MSPAVVASRLDYQNKLVPIDRVLHALKSCRLGRIDRNHHEGGDYGLFWHQKSRRDGKLLGKKVLVRSKCRRNQKCVAVLAAQFKRIVVYYKLHRLLTSSSCRIFCHGVEPYIQWMSGNEICCLFESQGRHI